MSSSSLSVEREPALVMVQADGQVHRIPYNLLKSDAESPRAGGQSRDFNFLYDPATEAAVQQENVVAVAPSVAAPAGAAVVVGASSPWYSMWNAEGHTSFLFLFFAFLVVLFILYVIWKIWFRVWGRNCGWLRRVCGVSEKCDSDKNKCEKPRRNSCESVCTPAASVC